MSNGAIKYYFESINIVNHTVTQNRKSTRNNLSQ